MISWKLFDGHLYPGGGWRIHMLRQKLGDEIFWTAVKDYIHSFANQTVETDDFRKILEKHSGFNLTKFFDQVSIPIILFNNINNDYIYIYKFILIFSI